MKSIDYVGLDVHKKTLRYCVKTADGRVGDEGCIPATRKALTSWATDPPHPWIGAMEATLFTGWVYDHLRPHARGLKVAHPPVRQAIVASKRKMEVGVPYSKQKLHGKRYFAQLLASLQGVPDSVIELLEMSRGTMEMFQGMQRQLIDGLRRHPALEQRVNRLMTIPGVGEVTALT